MENHQKIFDQHQDILNQLRVQQLEAVASHYTKAANYLSKDQKEASVKCIQKGQQAAKLIWQITTNAFTRPNTQSVMIVS